MVAEMEETGLLAGVAVVVFVLIVLLIVLIYLIISLRRKSSPSRKKKTPDHELGQVNENGGYSNVVDQSGTNGTNTPSARSSVQQLESAPPPVEPRPDENTFIEIERLGTYTQEKFAKKDAFKREYMGLPSGLIHSCDAGKIPENLQKNRYRNILPYDDQRVVLDAVEGAAHSDYINASFIDGYGDKPRYYVAAQGPMQDTLGDAWRMIWQLKINCIVKLTPLAEAGKVMVARYWPNRGEQEEYDGIAVTTTEEEVYAHFVLRIFKITHQDETRTVRQLQYTLWPDRDIPEHIFPLLQFRQRVKLFEKDTTGPLLIHCSAGVGRTGAYMAIDCLMEQAEAEKGVDVFQCVKKLRQQRTIMVQTLRQYIFIHETVAEGTKVGMTAIPCDSLDDTYKQLTHETGEYMNTNKLVEQFELLKDITKQTGSEEANASLSAENKEKNRDLNIVPQLRHRPFLAHIEGAGTYINAVYVSSYKSLTGFLVTQLPLKNTIIDFWRLLYDHNINSVILTETVQDDKDFPQYWESESPLEIDHLTVTVQDEKEGEEKSAQVPGCASTTFTVTNTNKPGTPLTVRQWQLQCWPSEQEAPPDDLKGSMITLMETVGKWQHEQGKSPVLVVCKNGASRCGLVCGSSWVLDMLAVEQQVDVFTVIRHIRLPREQLVPTLTQYKFLHELALQYIDQFQTYANFGAGGQMSSIL